ncbi:sugar ABC transporter ATP-binding protein [Allorhodopirellula solitaria]|uniref:Galactose/methyl galactoside import ATP-binding protein MglA n=1 Tax=Allorhodopirellula solitaria TaxID=2527987 RepID=A0A5C5XWX0_9BACT|nr:sugar ABC transporter ATP-binding protein [Allorhodopirellula solitaria]TWT67188.1 Galactose/methyl galactoside import ATP-binding protein MglA [Allorhodopirellula solitaria]
MTDRLQLTRIGKSFGATRALDSVDLHVAAGEVHAIIGENGAGKSTLMKILSGAHRPDQGEVRLDGQLVEFADPRQSQAAGVAMIYQELNLAPELSVCQNILLGHEIRPTGTALRSIARRIGWIDGKAERRWASEALEKLNCGHLALDRPAGELPIAEQQMVEIARAIVTSQHDTSQSLQLLILDEPTSSLTQVDTQRLFAVIEQLAATGVSVLYISHFLEECQRIADRFTVLRDGCSVRSGPMPKGETQPNDALSRVPPQAGATAGAPNAEAHDRQLPGPQVPDAEAPGAEPPASMDEIIHSMVGRELSNLYPQFAHTRGEVALQVRQLSSDAGPEAVDFEVHHGEIFGMAGLIGAGRTETLRALFGLDRLAGGKITVEGRAANRRRPDRSWARDRMGMVCEDRKNEGLFLSRSLSDNLTITRARSYRRFGLLDDSAMVEDTRRWMQNLDVKAASPDQLIGELSGGNQQKIALARLLLHDCNILLLDEPTRGIDIGSKSTIYDQIGRLARDGKAIVLVSSYLPELLGVCDRIGVFSRGRLVDIRATADWSEHQLLEAAIG